MDASPATEDRGVVNAGVTYRSRVGAAAAGRTVLAELTETRRRVGEETWRRRIADGEVTLDGARARADTRLAVGQDLAWRRPPWREPAVPLTFAILWRDEDLLVVAKPSGLPTMPGGGRFHESTLLRRVLAHDPRARPVHRLGRHTTGVVVCGRTPRARAALSAAFRSGAVRKEYVALVAGEVPAGRHVVTTPLGPVPHARLGTVTAATPDGRPARTELERVPAARERPGRSLVRVRIATGRPHQIRIHAAVLGFPLLGDPLYGAGGRPVSDALPADGGYALHAGRLATAHPSSGAALDVWCAPPPALRTAGDA